MKKLNMKNIIVTICFILSACATPGIVKLSSDTYVISRSDYGGIFGNAAVMKAQVIDEANNFAEEQGKVAKKVSIKEVPLAPGRLATIEYKFKLIDIKSKDKEVGLQDSGEKINLSETSDGESRKSELYLSPEKIKSQKETDSVAIIIGIQNYKKITKSEYSNSDARIFSEYAKKILGVKRENIKILVDDEADNAEIYRAFQNWLPLKVKKNKTDVYVFYSGHGLPSDDGNSLYFLPHGADRDFISKTAINQNEIVAALQASQPKSVTMFIDSCYSGQARTGETLLANARPLAIKAKGTVYPPEFAVLTASAPDQISSSSPDLKHGIFSFYLMKGMEGDADENKDGKITTGELQNYLSDMVARQAMGMNRKQQTQLIGDSTRVLVGR